VTAGNEVAAQPELKSKGAAMHRSMRVLACVLAACVAPLPASAAPFEQTLELQGIRFHVSCPNAGSVNRLRIAPSGLQVSNAPVEREVDGTVTGAEVADLDGDGSPEVYVYVTSAGSGSYGSLVAYAANNRKSMSEIYLPDLMEDKKHRAGYMGHDRFAVGEQALLRRFPLYRKGDPNAKPSGGTRQLQYRLKPGEAGWRLEPYRVVDF
jgi:hypothetical protein